jgi:hypothetical protein
MLRIEGGRDLSDADGRPAASLPSSKFLDYFMIASRVRPAKVHRTFR